MTYLRDILNVDEFIAARQEGLIRVQTHPTEPLSIANYTEKAQYSKTWNTATLTSRGLIYNSFTTEVVARPFPKFFNIEENESPSFNISDHVVAFDKLDGSLGILYPEKAQRHGYAVATRGSFTSDQSKWATEWLNAQETFPWDVSDEWTCLVEIIYPENRIVVDYKGWEHLVYLGEIHKATGKFSFDAKRWVGFSTKVLYDGSFGGLAIEDRAGQEGLVIWCTHDNTRAKIKQEEYVRLHRIVTNLTPKRIWEMLKHDTYVGVQELKDQLPEEHAQWVEDTAINLLGEFSKTFFRFADLKDSMPSGITRKEIALSLVNEEPWLRACVFSDLDGKSIRGIIWAEVGRNMKGEDDERD